MLQDNLIILNFSEARRPKFSERRNAGYVNFGDENDYPDYLLSLYNRSSKHAAIIRGKVNYIVGNGWSGSNVEFIDNPNPYENLHDLTRKVSIDIEIFGGAYLEVIWSEIGGKLVEINHIDYTKIRTNKDNTQFWYKADWKIYKDVAEVIPAFNPNQRTGKQILYLKEYRPALNTYALPNYMAALNFIESDIEISCHVLGNSQTGFSPSKLITLPDGVPSDEEKRNLTKRFEKAYTGADGKKFILSFVNDPSRKPIIDDLGASDLTKEDFSTVDSLIQQNIFAAHQITTPSLFGISEAGKLGTRTEIRDGYEVFKNTYVNDKQKFIESAFNMLSEYHSGITDLSIQPVEPISYEFSEQTIVNNLTQDEIRDKLGLPPLVETKSTNGQSIANALNGLNQTVLAKVLENMTPEELRGLIGLSQPSLPNSTAPAGQLATTQESVQVNENIKNLTGRQHQQLIRIIRQYGKGQITRDVAYTLLKTGLGLNDSDITSILGETKFSEDEDLEWTIQQFASCGKPKKEYEVLKSKPYKFGEELEFQVVDKALDKKILQVLKKDPLIPITDLSKAVKSDSSTVNARLKVLSNEGIIKIDGEKKTLLKPLSEVQDKPLKTVVEVLYSYEWKAEVPYNQRNSDAHPSRPFCIKLMQVDRYWSRKEIEMLTMRLGYDVFSRGGGWWGDSFSCRHEWVSNILIKKNQ